jgi:hypothetical protein
MPENVISKYKLWEGHEFGEKFGIKMARIQRKYRFSVPLNVDSSKYRPLKSSCGIVLYVGIGNFFIYWAPTET